ncbi:MAG: RagB/SusD family nutrient uptake outer membrane protein [Prevotella sp.]|jgi:hypothetical protein
MNIKKSVVCGTLAVLALASCDDKMNYNEYNVYDKDYITSTFTKVGGFMTDIYNHVDYDFGQYYSGAILGSASDESEYAYSGNSIEDFYNGGWSAVNAKSTIWSSMFEGIYICNHVLGEMQGLTFDDLKLNSDYEAQMHRYENYKWECRFMRAYFYFNLVKQYGGVPIIDKEMTADEINQLSRNTSDEVFQFIIDECDAIKDSIIKDYADEGNYQIAPAETGRANNLAVLALKARAALYWASPLFNASGDKERYHDAALYCKQLIDSCTARGMALTDNYADLWATDNWSNENISKEIIFARRIYGSGTNGASNTFEGYNYPVGIEGGNGGNCPTQNLVDAYDMQATGLGIDEAGSGYDESNPYAGRDPRFQATIAKNGDIWPTSYKTTLETYQNGTNGQPLSGGTPTGYYVKKYCHGTIDLRSSSKYTADNHDWITFRLGEFYLDYAEAVFRYLGSADATSSEFPMSAREAASKTRVRAGMPAFPTNLSNDTFWEKYKKERMVELAFEGHRFWDVRRWKEADKYFKSITEMKLTKNDDGSISYTRNTVSRQWDDKMYLFPISQSDLLKNTNLEQNPGW